MTGHSSLIDDRRRASAQASMEAAVDSPQSKAAMLPFEKKIAGQIHAFDLMSLIKLLLYHGVALEEIIFKSHMSFCSQKTLIQSIEFRHRPRRVTISLNMGLLSVQTALPSYFQKIIAKRDIDSHVFADFIGYFDHFLIYHYIFNLYPELNPNYFSSWERTKRDYLKLLNLRSCSTLFWIFQLVFPELTIQVKKMVVSRDMQAMPLIIGETVLGSDAVFGKKAAIPVYGRHITLFSDREATETQTPWPKEIKRRLDSLIFPILRPAELDLKITFVIETQKRWMKLDSQSYLGYDKIKGGEAQYRRIRIFRGRLRSTDTVQHLAD